MTYRESSSRWGRDGGKILATTTERPPGLVGSRPYRMEREGHDQETSNQANSRGSQRRGARLASVGHDFGHTQAFQ